MVRSVFYGLAGFCVLHSTPLAGFSDATFDYLFGKNVRLGKPIITISQGSEELEDILLLR
jgi:hypothetical protein